MTTTESENSPIMSKERIAQLIDMYALIPHPEGGFYSEQFCSEHSVESPTAGHSRPAMTHIYFLLTAGQLSRWHRVLHDEVWNLYEGSSLRLLTFNNGELDDLVLSNDTHFFRVVKAGHYQAAESTGDYTLVGCSVAPGFDFADFSYIEDTDTQNKIISLEKDYKKFL